MLEDDVDPDEAFENQMQMEHRWDRNGILYSIVRPWPAQQVAEQMLGAA